MVEDRYQLNLHAFNEVKIRFARSASNDKKRFSLTKALFDASFAMIFLKVRAQCMGLPFTCLILCKKERFLKEVSKTTVKCYGDFVGAYLETSVILEIPFKWMHLASSLAAIRELQHAP